jgi:hypothetical protein
VSVFFLLFNGKDFLHRNYMKMKYRESLKNKIQERETNLSYIPLEMGLTNRLLLLWEALNQQSRQELEWRSIELVRLHLPMHSGGEKMQY